MDVDAEVLISHLESDRFIILEGIPGVGKTHLYKKLKEEKLYDKTYFLTFHPSTDYSEFVGGIKPRVTTQNKLQFQKSQGHILQAINEAKEGDKVLVWIDELNRGNVPQIFGDLITLLGNSDPPTLHIPSVGLNEDLLKLGEKGLYGLEFYVVATLNQSDKSVTPLDAAIRRRFGFLPLTNLPIDHPKIKDLANISDEEKEKFYSLNKFLSMNIGPEEQLGHSYLFKLDKLIEVEKKKLFWRHKIIPNIIEFLPKNKSHDLYDSINAILADKDLGIEMKGAENAPTFLSKFEESFGHTDDEIAKTIGNLLKMTSNVVLEGVPGTGKTRIRNLVVKELGIDEDHVTSTTFHPSTSYQEFIGGLYPAYDHSKPDELLFKFKEGTLIKAANRAMKKPKEKFLLFIDEINRGNIPMILGELMTIMEHTKRAKPDGKDAYREFNEERDNQVIIHREEDVTYSLQIPNNLYILATMNTSDRSVVSFDAAMRRRFSYFRMESLLKLPMPPELEEKIKTNWSKYSGYSSASFDDVINCLVEINTTLRNKLGPDAELGHSYCFLKGENLSFQKAVQRLFHNKILPQLADTISAWNFSPEAIVTEINLILSKLPQEKRLCEKALVILKHKINPNFSQIRVSKEGLKVEITLELIRALDIDRSMQERAYCLVLLKEFVQGFKFKEITVPELAGWYKNTKHKICDELGNKAPDTVHQNVGKIPNKVFDQPEIVKQFMDFVSKPRMDHGHIQHYITTGDESKLTTLKWVIEEIVDSFPNFEKRNKKLIGKSKTVYQIEKPDSKISDGPIWDAAFEVTDISDSEVTVVFQSGGGNGKQYPDYARGYESMVNNIMNLSLDVVKMETLFEKAFHEIDLPTNEMGMDSIPDINTWRKLTKEKFPKRKSGNSSIRLTLRHNFKTKEQEYLARIISGHPVWIKSG
jgi:5-methylcytosine-specific restriction endonuclease McrBC GTP-binding regulatory subunit McrB